MRVMYEHGIMGEDLRGMTLHDAELFWQPMAHYEKGAALGGPVDDDIRTQRYEAINQVLKPSCA